MDWRTARGFTLIELMVAISILAIISTAGLIIFTGAQRQARDGKRIGDLAEIQKALEQYLAINRVYPTDNGVDVGTITASNFGGYFRAGNPPQDPQSSPTNPNYKYYYCANPLRYIICAKLENCGSKCNRGVLPSPDGCQPTSDGGVVYYCLNNP